MVWEERQRILTEGINLQMMCRSKCQENSAGINICISRCVDGQLDFQTSFDVSVRLSNETCILPSEGMLDGISSPIVHSMEFMWRLETMDRRENGMEDKRTPLGVRMDVE